MPAWSRPIAASVRERRPSIADKYQHVKSVLDTGFNELKAKAQNQDSRPQARFQHGDPFKRIKARNLAELMSGHRLGYDCLLLDVRDVEEFNLCHLKGAMSYPARLLSRAVNPLSNKVLELVNVEGSIIVLHDLDGKIAAPACALLSEKGVENVVLLHGGLRAFAAKHAELLEGESPSLCSPRQTASLAGSTISRASMSTSCSAAVRRAREHISRRSGDDAWPAATSLLIKPPKVRRGSCQECSGPVEPLRLGGASQTSLAFSGPWK